MPSPLVSFGSIRIIPPATIRGDIAYMRHCKGFRVLAKGNDYIMWAANHADLGNSVFAVSRAYVIDPFALSIKDEAMMMAKILDDLLKYEQRLEEDI